MMYAYMYNVHVHVEYSSHCQFDIIDSLFCYEIVYNIL